MSRPGGLDRSSAKRLLRDYSGYRNVRETIAAEDGDEPLARPFFKAGASRFDEFGIARTVAAQ